MLDHLPSHVCTLWDGHGKPTISGCMHTDHDMRMQMFPKHADHYVKCTGSFLSTGCPDGQMQALTIHTLHQVGGRVAAGTLATLAKYSTYCAYI